MTSVKINKLKDGDSLKRKPKSKTWFKIITRGAFGVVITSTAKGSEYSALMKLSAIVFI